MTNKILRNMRKKTECAIRNVDTHIGGKLIRCIEDSVDKKEMRKSRVFNGSR